MDKNQSQCVFNTDPPNLDEAQIRDLLSQYYAIEGELKPLVSERDQNILIEDSATKWVLKIANAAEDPLIVRAQNQALMHLHHSPMCESVPKVMTNAAAEHLHFYSSEQGVHCVRLLSYLEGELYSQARKKPGSPAAIGSFVGSLSRSLAGFGHSGAHRKNFLWNLDEAINCKAYLSDIEDQKNRTMLAELFGHYESNVLPGLVHCRRAVIHHDVNDNNLILLSDAKHADFGLIDFGDLCFARQINELAVTMAYVLQGDDNIYNASTQIVKAYHQEFPLHENELDVLFDLIKMRLAMSVCISSNRAKSYSDNEYLRISQKPAFDLLWRLQQINPAFMTALLRQAAGFEPVTHAQTIRAWLASAELNPAPMFEIDLKTSERQILKLESNQQAARVEHFKDLTTQQGIQSNIEFLIGLYGEDRDVYQAEQFASTATPERRTVHLGLDIFVNANTALYSPLPGRVFSMADNNAPLDYGPTLILEHEASDSGVVYYTLYGHLSASVFELLVEEQAVEAGQLIGHIGEFSENGGWAPHLHFQLMTTMLGLKGNFNGVAEKSLWPLWQDICPDPNLITRLAPESFEPPGDVADLLEKRQRLLGPSLSLSYQRKLNIVRGKGAYLFDETGRQYLDCVNNICHVGHCHPQVVDALAHQASLLNTNTRYLNQNIINYAQRIADLFPSPLSVVFFVNSGTEANELALRIARTATGFKDTIVLDWGYHGNAGSTVEISPYKFKRKGGFAKPSFVEIAEFPNPFNGRYPGMTHAAGQAYVDSVAECVDAIKRRTGHGPAAFIAESISGVGGQVVYPPGYLAGAYQAVRAQGGLCIADEVQCGFGRVGQHYWAYDLQQVIPDIVVLGKPMGNGHPMAAVVTTAELASRFANGMEYFNSFGGNPVSMAVGMAVLDVIEDENLMHNANVNGEYLLSKFNNLKEKYKNIGDVRGCGYFLGIELVEATDPLKPATRLASDVVNELRENAVLFSTDGPHENVLKFKPPMVFSKADADFLVEKLDICLSKCC